MSSKAKKPTIGERLVRVKDLLPFIKAMREDVEAIKARLAALEQPKP